jgi:hypothetical protein
MSLILNENKMDLSNKNLIIEPDTICYVLITCKKANKNGIMQVDLKYEGDKKIARHMLKTAQSILQE